MWGGGGARGGGFFQIAVNQSDSLHLYLYFSVCFTACSKTNESKLKSMHILVTLARTPLAN